MPEASRSVSCTSTQPVACSCIKRVETIDPLCMIFSSKVIVRMYSFILDYDFKPVKAACKPIARALYSDANRQ